MKEGTAYAVRPVSKMVTWVISLASTLDDGAELLRKHHVSFDLQLATHKCLHAIELAVCHGDEVSLCHGDGDISRVFTPLASSSAVLEVDVELLVADNQLEDSTSLLDEVCTVGLDACFNLSEERLRHAARRRLNCKVSAA